MRQPTTHSETEKSEKDERSSEVFESSKQVTSSITPNILAVSQPIDLTNMGNMMIDDFELDEDSLQNADDSVKLHSLLLRKQKVPLDLLNKKR